MQEDLNRINLDHLVSITGGYSIENQLLPVIEGVDYVHSGHYVLAFLSELIAKKIVYSTNHVTVEGIVVQYADPEFSEKVAEIIKS